MLCNITQLRISHYHLAQTLMVSIDSMVLVIAKNQLKQNGIFFFDISEKYSFKGRRLTRLTNRLFVNVAKYFEREAKKPRAVRTLLRKQKTAGKIGYIK